MTAILSLAAFVAVLTVAIRFRRRVVAARWAVKDAATEAQYTMGTRYSSPAMAAPYDQQQAVQAHQRQQRQAAHARSRSRRAQDRVKPATVPFRKVAK